ncbi:MAG: glycosyltransferase [Actinomycetota bacterium]
MSNQTVSGESSAPEVPHTSAPPTIAAGPNVAAAGSADNRPAPQISLVIPTRNESGNIDRLVAEIGDSFDGFAIEIVFVDDSDDDTVAVVERAKSAGSLPIQIIHRPAEERAGGLGTAVARGLNASRAPWALVMDADLQHPPTAARDVASAALERDVDLVIGSRYVGKGAADGLSPVRQLMSSGARVLAKALFPHRLSSVSDPLSGMFAVRLRAVDLHRLQPSGFKILVEILLSQPPLRIGEVGYRFAEREQGESKASSGEMGAYLRLLIRRRLQVLSQQRSSRPLPDHLPVGS